MRVFLTALLAPVVVWAASCSHSGGHHGVRTEKLEPYSCGSIERLHTYDGVFLASQPQPADLERATESGVQTVVNLRKPEETDWDEAAVVGGLGMAYHSVPFHGPEELTDDVFDRARGLLNDPARKPLLLHCSSANRVGAVWLAHRVLDHGLTFEAAAAEAKTVGLRVPAYEQRAAAYIRERSAGPAE